jgi:hypothetical protein
MKTASFVQTIETKTVIPRALGAMLLVGAFSEFWSLWGHFRPHRSSIFSDVIAKVSSLEKIQQDHISYIRIESFSAAVILSQAGKDHEKSSEHESKDKQAAKLHKQCHDVGHAD